MSDETVITGSEEHTCPNLVPNAKWVQQAENPDNCPPCLLKPLAEFYLGLLEEEKLDDQVKKLTDAWATEDVLTIAKARDNIKEVVGEPLKKKLKGFDCSAQTIKLSAAET